MGIEDVDEREARRVAAAFGVREWNTDGDSFSIRGVGEAGLVVVCGIDSDTAKFVGVQINGPDRKISHLYDDSRFLQPSATTQPLWNCSFSPTTAYSMARGLYRLGFEDESILSQLPSLSAHEQMELRLSMPREFWPKSRLEEGQ